MNRLLRIIAGQAINYKENFEAKLATLKDIRIVRIPILMYHHIGTLEEENDNSKLIVTPMQFELQMRYLKYENYHSLTLDDLYDALIRKVPLPVKSIIITFDDGYYDFLTNAFPILKQYDKKSTIFISSSNSGKTNFLSWKNIAGLSRSSLISIGSHGHNHLDLTKINDNQLKTEIGKSKDIIERLIKKRINSFAYPFGRYNKRIIIEIQKANYKIAVSTAYGQLQTANNLYSLRRIRIGNKLDLSDFKRRISII